jgi:DNA-binding MarR family transcriptional regulator
LVDIINQLTMRDDHEQDKTLAHSTFVAFMTLFGSAQQVLKSRMQAEAEQGLGPLHLRALCLCQSHPGSTQQDLVQSMGRDKGQMARLIRDLEERQLLLRSPDANDRRVWRLAVTPAGDQKCQWFSALEAQLAADLFGGMAAGELEPLAQHLTLLQQRMDGMA